MSRSRMAPAFVIACALLVVTQSGAGAAPSGVQLGAVINEIQFAASAAGAAELRFEYVEIYNSAAATLDLTGWRLSDLASDNSFETLFSFPAFALTSGCYTVVYAAAAAGTLAEDSDCSDGRALLIAPGWTGARLNNAGDAVTLDEASSVTLQDFVYYDEANTGDPDVDDEAVAEGIWKDGAAIDSLSSGTTGRAIALRVDGAAPNEVNPAPDAEDLDWLQYSAVVGGTPGRPNAPPSDLIFKDGFEV